MGDLGIAGLFIALAVVIVLSGPARLLRAGKALGDALRGMRRSAPGKGRGATTGE
ncbi:MAG TPA: twin-arginine translocase TatA/TatE family subunit [Roseiflexaceae bacterium]|nr:twin-arginine translocase TatA/TatE family subunit [Roseiflexaceae bacterium]